jgi:hypothetical protein
MLNQFAVPGFGTPLRPAPYYVAITGIVRTLKPYATLRLIADKLNSVGLTTPSGKPWNRQSVSCYIRKHSL